MIAKGFEWWMTLAPASGHSVQLQQASGKGKAAG
jgi:hypothetical protein